MTERQNQELKKGLVSTVAGAVLGAAGMVSCSLANPPISQDYGDSTTGLALAAGIVIGAGIGYEFYNHLIKRS